MSKEEKNWNYLRKLLKGVKALFVLDGDIQKKGSGKFERWSSTSYTAKDAHGLLAGGHARVIAAAEIVRRFPDLKVVTTSCYKHEDPIHAEIYKEELQRLGVPEQSIEMECVSRSTLEELKEMVKMATKKGWNKVAMLTNNYHLPRVKEMYFRLGELEDYGGFDSRWTSAEENLEVLFLDAESILPLRDQRYKKIVEKVKCSEEYKRRVESEKRGIQAIREGKYIKK